MQAVDEVFTEGTEREIEDAIERAITLERAQRRTFLTDRQGGVGSSDLLGTKEYPKLLDGGALTVYDSKTRPITDEDLGDSSVGIDLLRGRLLEPIAATLFWRVTGRRGKREKGQRSHPDYPGARTSADATIFATSPNIPDWAEGTGGAEFKAPRAFVLGAMVETGAREGVIMQIQHSLAVRRLKWGSLAYCNLEHGDGPLVYIDVPADPDVGEFLLETCARFWREHVVPRIPPDPAKWAALLAKAPPIRETRGKLVVLDGAGDEAAEPMVERFLELTRLRKELEEARDGVSAALDDWLTVHHPDADKFQLPGIGKVTRVRSSRRTLQGDLLRSHRPIDRDAFVRWLREVGDRNEGALILPADHTSWPSFVESIADALVLDVGRFDKESVFSFLKPTPAKGTE